LCPTLQARLLPNIFILRPTNKDVLWIALLYVSYSMFSVFWLLVDTRRTAINYWLFDRRVYALEWVGLQLWNYLTGIILAYSRILSLIFSMFRRIQQRCVQWRGATTRTGWSLAITTERLCTGSPISATSRESRVTRFVDLTEDGFFCFLFCRRRFVILVSVARTRSMRLVLTIAPLRFGILQCAKMNRRWLAMVGTSGTFLRFCLVDFYWTCFSFFHWFINC
jgi:hypothetical protein